MDFCSIYDLMYEEYKIKKPIRLIELFAGYGSQALALKYLGANFEHWKICEWAIPSIIAYADVHRDELAFYGKDFSQLLTKEEIVECLFDMGVSADYNKPATLDQLKRMPESKLRLTYNAIQCTHNLVDISRVKGNDLEIKDTDEYTYLLTYSFPCQDLSLAGKRAGMEKDTGTRSGLLWEVERILDECGENLPQVLVMENVSQVHCAGNSEHFKQWQLRLEEMGYESYWEDLSATDFCIPQTRVRTFMVSILSQNGAKFNFNFPKKTELKLRLKDLLESNVDEKFYLSDKMINYISTTGSGGFKNKDSKINLEVARPLTTDPNKRAGTTNYLSSDLPENYDLSKVKGTKERANMLLYLLQQNKEIETHYLPNGCDSSLNNPKIREVSNTITTRYDAGIQNQQQIGMCVIEKAKRLGGLYDSEDSKHQAGSIYDKDYSAPTLDCSSGGGHRQPFIVEKGENNKNLKTSLENIDLEDVEDVAYIDAYNKKTITDGTAKTILTGVDFRNQDFLLIKNATKKGYLEAEEGDGIDISSRMETHRGTVQKGKAQTVTTMGGENVGVVVKGNTPKADDVINPLKNQTDKSWFFEQQVYDENGSARSLKATEGSGNVPKVICKDIHYTEKSLEKIKNNIVDENGTSGSLTATGMQSINHDGCQKRENLKSIMAQELIKCGKVKENDVIRHSYTNSRIKGEMKDLQQNNISPTLDTRADCLGVVVKDNKGE